MSTTPPNDLKAKAAAYKLTQRFGIRHPKAICLEDIAMARKVLVLPGPLEGCEARLTRKGSNGIIRVRAGEDQMPRRRFSIAHELGHWEMHNSSQWYACTAANLRDYRVSPEEREANIFASELLMPRFLAEPLLQKPEPTLALAKQAAAEFNVSLTAAAIRMLHLSRHEAVLICSKNKEILWWVIAKDRFGVWFKSKQHLHPESIACCLENGEIITGVQDVKTEVWFPNSSVSFGVSEESIRFPNLGMTLTLLTVCD
jgi:hypothetical protein